MNAREDLINGLTEHACCFSEEDALRLLDAYAAEVRRTDATRLLTDRTHYRSQDIFCRGIEHAAGLLATWANEATR